MSFLRDIWGDLVEKRLWPVAAALVVAIVAVPVVMSGGAGGDDAAAPAPGAPATAAPATAGSAPGSGQVVSLADNGASSGRATGTYHDPFAGAAGAHAKAQAEGSSGPSSPGSATARAAAAAAAAAAKATSGGSGGGSGGSSGASGASSGAPTTSSGSSGTPASAPTTVSVSRSPSSTGSSVGTTISRQAPRIPAGIRVDVTWGRAGAAKRYRDFVRLGRLMTKGFTPVAVLFGVRGDHKTAVFILPEPVSAVGDGHCLPSPKDCQLLELKAGESEFFDVTTVNGVVQYELDVDKVARRHAGTKAKARELRRRESKAGRKLMFTTVRQGRTASTDFMYKSRFGILLRQIPGR